MAGFNPRPRERGDSIRAFDYADAIRFQSTPPREGRQDTINERILSEDVSIHAPARGATEVKHGVLDGLPVSIHAPARGATGIERTNMPETNVSIHAPARGATL